MRPEAREGVLRGLREFMGEPDEIVGFVSNAEILVNHLAPLSGEMLDALPALRLVAVSRGGPVNIDMAAARARNVKVVNVPGRNASAVAEFTIGAILSEDAADPGRARSAATRARGAATLYRADRTGRELSEMTVGIVGYGAVGSRVGEVVASFRDASAGGRPLCAAVGRGPGCRRRARRLWRRSWANRMSCRLHARVTAETTGMMDEPAFAAMRPGAILVNTARGPLVDYAALYAALADGRLGGAMLDTFAVEPVPPDWPLLALPNVTLTPHIAGASVKTVTYAARQVAEEVRRYLRGEALVNLC